ncbi:MAG: alpha/beta hydrolase [Tannerella sp.]|jgi:acetyl esterase/lipase|nr:alpha/beta hydrolase [Tannerella sp.]
MKHIRYSIITFFLAIVTFSATTMNAQKIVKLWDGDPPVSNDIKGEEIVRDGKTSISNVSVPELEIYLSEKSKATGMAVIVCPGGGYAGLAYDHEGLMVARWLNKEGIAAFILKYRMPNGHKEVPLDDAQQAIRHVREQAGAYGVNPSKIGICGFSAGGHLASTASTHFTTAGTSARPDFSILFYPVITMTERTHGGSRHNLLGENPSKADLHRFSNEKQVNVNTPPAIILLSDDDKVVLPENSLSYYKALKQNDIPATMYIFPTGGHGWGFRDTYEYHSQMTDLLSKWLKTIND